MMGVSRRTSAPQEVRRLLILTVHQPTLLSPEFRISVECDGWQADVRPGERAALFSDGWAIISRREQDAPVETPTAFDRVDDRSFPGDWSGHIGGL